MALLTSSQVNKAGRTLRKHVQGTAAETGMGDDLLVALEVLVRYRAQHQLPLTKATMGLRSVVRTERAARVEVSQRLKRVPTIVEKLAREPTLALANMQETGGCRAVLASIDEMRRVQARLARNRPPVSVSDYVAEPRASGYRVSILSSDSRATVWSGASRSSCEPRPCTTGRSRSSGCREDWART